MRVAVAGGTGFLGRAIVAAAAAAGHEVLVLSRNEPDPATLPAGARWQEADVGDLAGLAFALAGSDAVVDAVQFPNSPIENRRKGHTFREIDLHGTQNLVDAARSADAGLFVGLSGAGASDTAGYKWLRFKREEEQYIAASGLAYVIFRPSWVYGPGDNSLNRFLAFARWLPLVPLVGSGRTPVNPLFIDDLARHVVRSLDLESARGRLFEIGGPETHSLHEIVATALRVAGKRRLLLPQPKPLLKPIAFLLQFLPGRLRLLTPDAVDFITMPGVTENAPLVETFGLPLTPLEEGLATYLT